MLAARLERECFKIFDVEHVRGVNKFVDVNQMFRRCTFLDVERFLKGVWTSKSFVDVQKMLDVQQIFEILKMFGLPKIVGPPKMFGSPKMFGRPKIC